MLSSEIILEKKTIKDITKISIIRNIFAIFNKINFFTFQRSFCEKRYHCFPEGFVIYSFFCVQITVVWLFFSSQQFFTKIYLMFELLLIIFSSVTTWKGSKHGVISCPYFPGFGLNTGKYVPEIIPYLDTFHAVCPLKTYFLI